MQADYKRDVNHSYLILYGKEEVNTSGYQTRMLLCNHFSSLLPCRIQSMDGQNLFYYEITSHQAFSERYENRKIGQEEMRAFFQGMIQAVQELGSYLLNADDLVLDPAFVYVQGDLSRVRFCYLPGYGREIGRQFLELTEYLLPRIDHRENQAVTLGYGMYRIAMEEEFQIDKIKEELYREYERESEEKRTEEEHREEACEIPETGFCGNSGAKPGGEEEEPPVFMRELPPQGVEKWIWEIFMTVSVLLLLAALFLAFRLGRMDLAVVLMGIAALTGVGVFVFWIVSRRKKAAKEGKIWEPKESIPENRDPKDWKEKVVKEEKLSAAQENGYPDREETPPSPLTMVLSESCVRQESSLISREEGRFPTILLDRDLMIIGKLDTVSDVILPYPTVSRVHSKIRRIEGEYYLMDLNSRNGTYVNGRMLQAEEEYQLQDQDEVRFADLTYLFLK